MVLLLFSPIALGSANAVRCRTDLDRSLRPAAASDAWVRIGDPLGNRAGIAHARNVGALLVEEGGLEAVTWQCLGNAVDLVLGREVAPAVRLGSFGEEINAGTDLDQAHLGLPLVQGLAEVQRDAAIHEI